MIIVQEIHLNNLVKLISGTSVVFLIDTQTYYSIVNDFVIDGLIHKFVVVLVGYMLHAHTLYCNYGDSIRIELLTKLTLQALIVVISIIIEEK